MNTAFHLRHGFLAVEVICGAIKYIVTKAYDSFQRLSDSIPAVILARRFNFGLVAPNLTGLTLRNRIQRAPSDDAKRLRIR